MENFQRTKELTKERLLARRRERRNRLLWHVAICSAVVVMIISIAAMVLKAGAEHESAKKADELTKRIENPPQISQHLLTINEYSRPGTPLEQVNGIVIHYTGNPGTTAMQNRNYFEGLAEKKNTKASSHYIIGLSGEIIQCVPLEEVSYASNERNGDTIAIECCIDNAHGKFNEKTYNSLVELTAWLVGKYNLKIEDVIRHYDITGKECPKYFVEHESAWEDFKLDLEKYIDENGVTF